AAAPAVEATAERRLVTVLFTDLVGFTSLAEDRDPEAVRELLSRYFDTATEAVKLHGGTVEKFIGDAVMAVFGVPLLHEDDALRAVRAAEGMRAALEALNADLERDHGVGLSARIGVSTGEVVAGDVSAGQRLVTGDAVNVAARLEQAARPGEILLGEPTYRLVRDAVEVEAVDPLELKGKAEPTPAYRLTAVRQDVQGHARHLDSPMVGRAKELDLLAHALDRAVTERTSHLFTLLGSAGVGKSRLVAEFLAGGAAGTTVLRGRCLSYGEGITFFPLAEAILQAAGVDQTDDLTAARAKLTSLLDGADASDRISPLVAGVLSWDEPGATEDAFWAVRKLVEHLARDRPLVLVFDDVHWAEPTFLDLVEHLADWTRDAALLLVCVARPELLELRPNWAGGKLNATSILLEPLDGDAASTLLDNLLGRAEIPAAARARILEGADGNPLFVEEMLGMLIDDGLLRFDDGAWRAVENLADITVPPTIQLLLAARLDRLDAEERAVIERGAVEGKVFHTGAVAALAPDVLRPHVPSRLLALARKELIRPDRAEFAGEDAFRFRHLLIRDAAYHAMPKEHRADLHERFARWLEDVAGERAAEYEEILGYHLEQAYRFRTELGPEDERARAIADAAAERLLSSAVRAEAREDYRSMRQLLRRSVDLARGRRRVEATLLWAEAEFQLGDYLAAADRAREAMAMAIDEGDRVLALRAELVLVESLGQTDPGQRLSSTMAAITRIRRELQGEADEPALVQAVLAEARHEFYAGRCDHAREVVEEIASRSSHLRATHRRELAVMLGVSAYFGSTPIDDALALRDRIERLAPGGVVSVALFANARFPLLAMAGRADEALEAARLADRLWGEIANPGLEMTRYQGLGEGFTHLGLLDEAERSFRRGVEILDSLGETGFNSTLTALHGAALCRLGRFEEALAQAERARELSAEDDFSSQAAWRRSKAWALSARGDHDEALRLIDEATTIVEDTDYLDFRGETAAIRGLVLRGAGRVEEARAAYRQALECYERKGAVLAADRIRRELEALDEG
ncbi:MAG TPA: adenylate/guanylate cyclase domain-containing protein, partial [Actinomycetota bacterium]|nr:adenylate/guanylate cyclase domain-containing protein [Actinomycetota bacterium]